MSETPSMPPASQLFARFVPRDREDGVPAGLLENICALENSVPHGLESLMGPVTTMREQMLDARDGPDEWAAQYRAQQIMRSSIKHMRNALDSANVEAISRTRPGNLLWAYEQDVQSGRSFAEYPALERFIHEVQSVDQGHALAKWLHEQHRTYEGLHESVHVPGTTQQQFQDAVRERIRAFKEAMETDPVAQAVFGGLNADIANIEKRPTRQRIENFAHALDKKVKQFGQHYDSKLNVALFDDRYALAQHPHEKDPRDAQGEVMSLVYRWQWAKLACMASGQLREPQKHGVIPG